MAGNGNSNSAGGGRKAGVANYTHDELDSLIGMILNRVPISNDEWDCIVADHAKAWPFFRTRSSIKTKYAAIKRIKSSTGNPNMPAYVRMAREAHILIGRRANLGTGEEDFDLVEGYVKSEAGEGSAPTKNDNILAEVEEEEPPIVLAGEEQGGGDDDDAPPVGGDEEEAPPVVPGETPARASVTPVAKKRAYQLKKSSVPDAAAFNDFIKNHEKREERNLEIWKDAFGTAEKVAKDFLGAAVNMFNTWHQQQQQQIQSFQQQSFQQQPSYHGPPYNGHPPPQYVASVELQQPPHGVVSTPRPHKRQRREEKESHGDEKETGIL